MAEKTPTVQKPDELQELRRENDELLTKLKYLQAEFENYRKRAERDAEVIMKFAQEGLLARLLPALDEMDAAVATLKAEAGDGIRMVRDNLVKALGEVGLQEIPALGQSFSQIFFNITSFIAPAVVIVALKAVFHAGIDHHIS